MSDASLTSPPGQASDPSRQPWLEVSWVDFLFCAALIIAGFFYLRDAPHWARNTYVGNAQYGDAEFWWNGALHFSHGIIAENPNLTYRMGYAVFGGLVAAVCGPDYHVFHQILLGLFLITAGGLYLSLRDTVGRIAAAATGLFLVFNPFTAEWIAVSTSDGLGMILNLAALLALIAGVRGQLKPGWIILFGLLFSCGSLTRPLVTPFIVPAVIAVIAASWGKWRQAALGVSVMLVAFMVPTLAWMGVMAATTGNFALTGASQDASTFYAASDPQIQVWRGDMFTKVQISAQEHFHVANPDARQMNAEFWILTQENYRRYWRYHLARLWPHSVQLAGYTSDRCTYSTGETKIARTHAKWALVLVLFAVALWRRRWAAAVVVGGLGWVWAAHPELQPWAVIGASAVGFLALFFNRRAGFLWAAFWWVGVAALYLIGGTWGPPLGPVLDLNALGYRLGFQFFFVSDLLVIGVLGAITQGKIRPAPASVAGASQTWLTRSSPVALRLVKIFLSGAGLALGLLLATGAVIVGSRMIALSRARPVAYPALTALAGLGPVHDAQPVKDQNDLMIHLNAHAGARLVVTAMSSGFVWNLPGQQRCVLLLYRQDFVRPVLMNPRRFDVEIPRHLPEREWMGRQGAWVVRSFPDTAQVSNLPYYVEVSAVQAFIPLTADGHAYDLGKKVIFPLAKSATQLTAAGDLNFIGARPEWSLSSGQERYPRRFALRPAGSAPATVGFTLSLDHARGQRTLHLGVLREPAAGSTPRPPACVMKFVGGPEAGVPPLWQTSILAPPADIQWAEIPLGESRGTIQFTSESLQPGDTLWVYELVLTADDFTN